MSLSDDELKAIVQRVKFKGAAFYVDGRTIRFSLSIELIDGALRELKGAALGIVPTPVDGWESEQHVLRAIQTTFICWALHEIRERLFLDGHHVTEPHPNGPSVDMVRQTVELLAALGFCRVMAHGESEAAVGG